MMTTTTTDSGARAATPSGARKKRGVRGDNQNNRGRRIDPAFIWMTVPAAAVFTVLLTIPLLSRDVVVGMLSTCDVVSALRA